MGGKPKRQLCVSFEEGRDADDRGDRRPSDKRRRRDCLVKKVLKIR